jgi:hypothetical protein
MPDLAYRRHFFQLRILQNEIIVKGLVQGYVDVAIDRGGYHEAAVLLVVRGQVRAAAAE